MRAEVRAGRANPQLLLLSADDEHHFDDKQCTLAPVSFGLADGSLTLSIEFSTESSMAPIARQSEASKFVHDDYYDEEAAGSAVLSEVLHPLLARNQASISHIEPTLDYAWPPWRWKAQVKIITRMKGLREICSFGSAALL